MMLKITIIFILLFACSACNYSQKHNAAVDFDEDTVAWKSEAKKMVNEQIRSRGVLDQKLLNIMRQTPRHEFVPVIFRDKAYADRPLPIGYNQTISQPYIVALMTELLHLMENEKVLEIGTGSGYQAAILAQMTDTVYTIELLPELANAAEKRLKNLHYNNVFVKCGDGYKGWPEKGPFDAIIVTAAPPEIPQKLIDQLKVKGRMVLPVGDYYQELLLIRKTKNGYQKEHIAAVRFVPMVKPKPIKD